MDEFLNALVDSWSGSLTVSPTQLLFSMACALLCGAIISEIYRRTHRGADYTRSFLQVLILVTIIVAFVTLIVGNDLARAFTLVGALSVVRFRTAVKDARDLGFIFWGVAAGMGAGVQLYSITLLACLMISVIVFVMFSTNYGMRDAALKVLRVRTKSDSNYNEMFKDVFGKYVSDSRRLSVALMRQGLEYELVFSVRLRDESKESEFVAALRELNDNYAVTLTGRDQETLF